MQVRQEQPPQVEDFLQVRISFISDKTDCKFGGIGCKNAALQESRVTIWREFDLLIYTCLLLAVPYVSMRLDSCMCSSECVCVCVSGPQQQTA